MWRPLRLTAALSASWSAAAGGLGVPTAQPELPLQCDVDVSGPICLGSQAQVLLPPALPDGLVGFWSFDESSPLDSSGAGNHGLGPVRAGPSLAGRGSSAFFHRSALEVPGGEALSLRDFSYTFWLYLVESPVERDITKAARPCPLLRKGRSQSQSAAPAIFFQRASRQLRVELSTAPADEEAAPAAQVVESSAKLGSGRWYHVAVVRADEQRMTKLYVNGILDSSRGSEGYIVTNQEPLLIGGDPGGRQHCDLPVYIDELRIYNRPLEVDAIQAEAAPSLGGVEPSMVRLACVQCTLEEAIQNCPEGYHICSSLELHMGGYQVARALGWMEQGVHVWSHASKAGHGAPDQVLPSALAAGPAQPLSMLAQAPAASPVAAPQAAPAQAPSAAPPLAAPGFAPAPAPGAGPRQTSAPAPAQGEGLGLCCSDA